MSKVFVLDTHLKQLNPIHPGRARILLASGKAAVYRRYPFTIVLKTASETPIDPLQVKIDPGSKTTGMAIVNKDAAAVNTTRQELLRRLQDLGLPIECGSAGLTKYNRIVRQLPKTHWIDAACVGESTPETLKTDGVHPLFIQAVGSGNRQMCGTDKCGFPTRHRQRQKRYFGFQTADMVRATVTKGKKIGIYTGKILVRATGSFDIVIRAGRVQGISYRYCQAIHRADGYSYSKRKAG